ncbi:DUF4382 domain-containing protein [Roseateles sp.]|uniref:DUF4382 domain-containing protein n=1 Tax=Roseateles sp. TaxID=1971397 RepID=UPI002DFE9AE4|nr:DUF4382 domain-containing protein [Roseateles sp.]
MKMKTLLALSLAAYLLAGCGGGGGDAGTPVGPSTSGTLVLSLTDAPSCGYDHVYVTVQKVRVNASASASDTDAGWTDLTVGPTQRFDLLALGNGVLASLGQLPLPAGHYSQLRLVLADNDAAHPLANSVVPTGGAETALTTPSGQQSGVKLNADITIAANQIADFVLDFDACKSVVTAGASGQRLLKPVVSVLPHLLSGVSGYVDPAIANGATAISVQQGGVVLKATAPDAAGKFVLAPVAPGNYDLVVRAAKRATLVMTGVPVTADSVTAIASSAAPLLPPTAVMGQIGGSVTAAGVASTAAIAATQKLASGATITVAETQADATTGAYMLTLPATPPWVAPYATPPASFNFAPDSGIDLPYTLAASLNGTTKTAGPLTLAGGAVMTANFGF